jgi:hypothetical protein
MLFEFKYFPEYSITIYLIPSKHDITFHTHAKEVTKLLLVCHALQHVRKLKG